jgi:hypothetical protein
MGWHDGTIWSMLGNPDAFELLFDLDYIFKWVEPNDKETYYKFWVAPVTMLFENIHDIYIDIESELGKIEIVNFHREIIKETINSKFIEYLYRFECQEGEISLIATKYTMFVREIPELLQSQSFKLEQRKGISFARTVNKE